jgi:hypothetical protein
VKIGLLVSALFFIGRTPLRSLLAVFNELIMSILKQDGGLQERRRVAGRDSAISSRKMHLRKNVLTFSLLEVQR